MPSLQPFPKKNRRAPNKSNGGYWRHTSHLNSIYFEGITHNECGMVLYPTIDETKAYKVWNAVLRKLRTSTLEDWQKWHIDHYRTVVWKKGCYEFRTFQFI